MLHHRPVSTSPLPQYELLGPFQEAKDGLELKPRQLPIGSALVVVLLLLSLGTLGYFSYRGTGNSLSPCAERLAAAGFELSAASLARPFASYVDEQSASQLPWRADERRALYHDLAAEMQRKGLHLAYALPEVPQTHVFNRSRSPAHWKRPTVKPILQPLQVPVRSIVLPLHDSDAAVQITSAVRKAVQDVLSADSVWWQEEHLMHAPMLHTSVQGSPAVPDNELEREDIAVLQAAKAHCPIHAVLDRVVVSYTGVILAVWQVLPGSSEPAVLRSFLSTSITRAPAPEQQPVQYPAMLHTTVGHIVGPPRHPDSPGQPGQEWDTVFLQSALVEAMEDVSNELCGLTASFSHIWHVKEKELMALSLGGHFSKTSHRLSCLRPSAESHLAAAAI